MVSTTSKKRRSWVFAPSDESEEEKEESTVIETVPTIDDNNDDKNCEDNNDEEDDEKVEEVDNIVDESKKTAMIMNNNNKKDADADNDTDDIAIDNASKPFTKKRPREINDNDNNDDDGRDGVATDDADTRKSTHRAKRRRIMTNAAVIVTATAVQGVVPAAGLVSIAVNAPPVVAVDDGAVSKETAMKMVDHEKTIAGATTAPTASYSNGDDTSLSANAKKLRYVIPSNRRDENKNGNNDSRGYITERTTPFNSTVSTLASRMRMKTGGYSSPSPNGGSSSNKYRSTSIMSPEEGASWGTARGSPPPVLLFRGHFSQIMSPGDATSLGNVLRSPAPPPPKFSLGSYSGNDTGRRRGSGRRGSGRRGSGRRGSGRYGSGRDLFPGSTNTSGDTAVVAVAAATPTNNISTRSSTINSTTPNFGGKQIKNRWNQAVPAAPPTNTAPSKKRKRNRWDNMNEDKDENNSNNNKK